MARVATITHFGIGWEIRETESGRATMYIGKTRGRLYEGSTPVKGAFVATLWDDSAEYTHPLTWGATLDTANRRVGNTGGTVVKNTCVVCGGYIATGEEAFQNSKVHSACWDNTFLCPECGADGSDGVEFNCDCNNEEKEEYNGQD